MRTARSAVGPRRMRCTATTRGWTMATLKSGPGRSPWDEPMKSLLAWFDRRLGFSKAVLPIIQHPVPKNVNWWYVFGSATLVAFAVQIVTGVALAFTYVPAPSSAYESLQFITDQALLGGIVRGIHYWGGSAMVVLIFIHMCRTYLMGSFKFPRELNWLTGVLLFGLTLGMAFTGQLLRWDQDAYWAVAVGRSEERRVGKECRSRWSP